jgi:ABC-type transport system involved in multi-copper enzyme maturation permease subunit
MIDRIVRKELREILTSTKFSISFAVCAVLILLTFYVGAQNHRLNISRYEAAQAENLRKMEGLTDWTRVTSHRIFLPPRPLESLVNGISYDIGRTVQMSGQGELFATGSRYSEDPIFAVFRFLDLNFIVQVVLSLFAILFAYDAVNGEKERGTLRLTFSNPVPRASYLFGKWLGAFLAVGVPLLVTVILGTLLLPLWGVYLTGEEWVRLGLIVLSGLLMFGVFLTLSILMSVSTRHSTSSFLAMLVIWIFSVLVIPRASVLLAGRAVDVPSVDDLAHKKAQYRRQLWMEDQEKLRNFEMPPDSSPEEWMKVFNAFMSGIAEERTAKMDAYSGRLNRQRRMKQEKQRLWAFGFSRISPSALFSLAASRLSDTGLELKSHFLREAGGYQQTYGEFMKEKTGIKPGSGMVMMRIGSDDEEKETINAYELPSFRYRSMDLGDVVQRTLPDIGLLFLYQTIFFAAAFVRFLRYDLR